MRIQILGTGCAKCRALERNARRAADEAGLDSVIEKVDSLDDIVAMGVVQTPALAVDGKVLISGRLASAKEILELLAED